MIPLGVTFAVGALAIVGLFLTEWPEHSKPGRETDRCDDCRQSSGHDFDCSFWARTSPADPLDDPYARGLEEDRYHNALIGEPTQGDMS